MKVFWCVKKRDIALPTKVYLVKDMVFPVVTTQLSLLAAGHPPTRHSIGDPVPDEVSGTLLLDLIWFPNPLLLYPGQGPLSVSCSQGF